MPRPCRLCGPTGVSPFPEQPPWRRPNCNGPAARAGVDRVMDGFVTETMLDESEAEVRVSRPLGAPAFEALVARVPSEDLPAWEEGETAEDAEDTPEDLTEEDAEEGEAAPAANAEAEA